MNNKTTKLYKLGRNIAKRRRELSITQNVLAERINISREHLAKIEIGIRALSLDLLFRIAEELSITEKDLFDFNFE